MAELESTLRELGRELEFPPTPDLALAVRERLDVQVVRAGARRSLFRRAPSAYAEKWRRPLAIALAVLVVTIGAVLAVPPARTAILDWLGLRNVSVVRVEKLPTVPTTGRLDLGRRVSLDEARRLAPWLLVPEGEPDGVYVSKSLPGGKVTLLWGTPSDVRLLLTEITGKAFIEKVVEGNAEIEPVDIGRAGAWFQGPHVVMFSDRDGVFRESRARLAANTLVWQEGDVTLRLEGDLTKEEALRIARSAD
jgi:hypothetical protein